MELCQSFITFLFFLPVFPKAGKGGLHCTSAGSTRAVQWAGTLEGLAVCGFSSSVQLSEPGCVRVTPCRPYGEEEGELSNFVSRCYAAFLRHNPARRQVSQTSNRVSVESSNWNWLWVWCLSLIKTQYTPETYFLFVLKYCISVFVFLHYWEQ